MTVHKKIPATWKSGKKTALNSKPSNKNLSDEEKPSSNEGRQPGVPSGPHFAHTHHYVFNVDRLYEGKEKKAIDDESLIEGLSGQYIGALTFSDEKYAKIDFGFAPVYQNKLLSGNIEFVVTLDNKKMINFRKNGELRELIYLGQDSVPSVGEVSVFSLQVSGTENIAFTFPVNDKRKAEGAYFKNGQRVGSLYFYKSGVEWP